MLLGALIDLGANRKSISETLNLIPDVVETCKEFIIEFREVRRGGVRALSVVFRYEDQRSEMSGVDLINYVKKLCKISNLSERAVDFCERVANTIVHAEAKIHGAAPRDVHLHELGSVDTIADIVGVACALDSLGVFSGEIAIYGTPVAIGGGTVRISHGVVSVPTPAVLEILSSRAYPFVGGPVEGELTTPTGAALLVNVVENIVDFYPSMVVERYGFGAGYRDIRGLVNVLRAVIGRLYDVSEFLSDNVCVLETNVDDATGEVIGYLIEKVMEAGARDASAMPIIMKKGRPAYLLRVICDPHLVNRITRVLIEESGTLGVRILRYVERRILNREIIPICVTIYGKTFDARVKVARDSQGRIIRIKAEYEDARNISRKTGVPLREAIRRIEEEARRMLKSIK